MDSIVYDIVWPGGNTTAIVRSHVPVTEYVSVAKRILAKHAEVEQVGFLLAPYNDGAQGRLAMMGGEFCGNATRCTAFLLAREAGVGEVRVEIPGLGEPVQANVTDTEASIRLPQDFCRKISPCPEGAIVDLYGIRHVVVMNPTAEAKESILERHKEHLPAVGLMYVKKEGAVYAIDPYVWVRDTDTFYHETACGSGSLAVAFLLQKNGGDDTLIVRQPSDANFTVTFETKPSSVRLSGPIRFVDQKTLA